MKMSVVHDMGESIIGDLTPHDGVSSEDKYNMEASAIKIISSYLPDTKKVEIQALFQVCKHADIFTGHYNVINCHAIQAKCM